LPRKQLAITSNACVETIDEVVVVNRGGKVDYAFIWIFPPEYKPST